MTDTVMRDYSSGSSGGAPTQETTPEIRERLEYLRGEINAERISMGELSGLQDYGACIPEGDVQLLEWAGVPEFPEMCTSDDPTNHQGDTCPIHESADEQPSGETRGVTA